MNEISRLPSFRYDPYSEAARRDPQSLYKTLLEHHRAYFMPEYDTYAISRFEDVWDAFMDSENFSETEGQVFSREKLLEHHRGNPLPQKLDPVDMFLFLDPPYHSRFRRAMAPPFAKGSIRKLEAEITRLVRDRLAELISRGSFDVNGDFGSYISVGGTSIVLGLPPADAPRLIALVNAMVARDPDKPGPTPKGALARAELFEYLSQAVALHRAGKGAPSAVLDSLIKVDVVGRPLTDTEIAADLIGILVGGTETVPKVFAGGLLDLWRRPEQLAAVRADITANTIPAFEEMLRYNAPAQWFGRTAKTRHTVAGVMLEPGQRVILLVAAANRDPREFDRPDEFIWNRTARRMLSFGVGPHFCIGIHLARLEGQIMLREFLTAVPAFTLQPEAGEFSVSEFQVGWTNLPIQIGTAHNEPDRD